MSLTPSRAALAVGLAVVVLGCASTVQTRTNLTELDDSVDISRVAIVPFRAVGDGAAANPQTAQRVARFVAEALMARGVEVIAAEDVSLALEASGSDPSQLPPATAARVANRQFGVGAIMTGSVLRYRDLSGQAMASASPASVWFEIVLWEAPGALRLWSAVFNETQRALSEDVFTTVRYPGRGMRWLRADELARWGASEVASQYPDDR